MRERVQQCGIGHQGSPTLSLIIPQVGLRLQFEYSVIADFEFLKADVVDLQYFLYKEDIERSAALGVKGHSFS